MLKTTRLFGITGIILLLAGVVLAAVKIEIGDDGDVTVTAPGDRVTIVDSLATPDTPPDVLPDVVPPTPPVPGQADPPTTDDPPAVDNPSPGGDPPAVVEPPVQAPDPATGFTAWPLHAEARAVYVASDGDDNSFGDTPAAPVRTLGRALQVAKSGRGDHILLRAGDTFTRGFGAWTFTKSGRDAQHPLLVGVYGDGPRPIIRTDGDGLLSMPSGATVRNIAIQGLRVVAVRRLPGHDAFNAHNIPYHEKAIYWLAAGENVHIEDCVIEGFNFNLVFQSPRVDGLRNVTLRRNIVVDAWAHWDSAKGGHSSGIYTDGLTGLRIEECLFDHNGWIDGLPGGNRTKFNHNIYVQSTCRDVAVIGNVIARGSSHGLQLRPGGRVVGNLFARNAMAVFVARSASTVAGNVVAESVDLSTRNDGARGYGIETLPVTSARITGNLLMDKHGRAGWAPAIGLTFPRDWSEPVERYEVTLEGNTIVRWPRDNGRRAIVKWDGRATVVKDAGNVLDRVSGGQNDPRFVDAGMTLDRAADGDFVAWLQRGRRRARGVWPPELSAEAINAVLFVAYKTR